jgi:phosphoesterase RecJ-like protein
MDSSGLVEQWNVEKHGSLPGQSALVILDTSDEYYIGCMKETLKSVRETFTFDHHEPNPRAKLSGMIEASAASTCELAVELAIFAGADLDPETAMAAYTGIVYDTGFFAYSKTSLRTFKAAVQTLEWGAQPNFVYRQLMENASSGTLLLQKRAFSTLELYDSGRIAAQILRKEDLEAAGANFEDAETFVNMPLKSKEVEVSLLVKETAGGEVRCSLRSKGKVNVSKIAQDFGGGGHLTAAGFKSDFDLEETVKKLLADVRAHLDKK